MTKGQDPKWDTLPRKIRLKFSNCLLYHWQVVYLKLTFHPPKCGFDPSIKLYGYKMGAGQLGMNITMDTVDVIINNTEI